MSGKEVLYHAFNSNNQEMSLMKKKKLVKEKDQN